MKARKMLVRLDHVASRIVNANHGISGSFKRDGELTLQTRVKQFE